MRFVGQIRNIDRDYRDYRDYRVYMYIQGIIWG